MIIVKHPLCHVGKFRSLVSDSRIVHGMSTRKGGASASPFDFLNIGANTRDCIELIRLNRARLFTAFGLESSQLVMPRQTHGDHVVHVTRSGTYEDTDALITNTPDIALTIQVADCVPVFLFDPKLNAIGLVHAGWRGSAQRITAKAVLRMIETFGCDPASMLACIGPSIGPCCYEVGGEVMQAFSVNYFQERNLDLWRVQIDQLKTSGIPESNIELAGLCTSCHADWFYSYRQSGGETGRLMGILMIESRVCGFES